MSALAAVMWRIQPLGGASSECQGMAARGCQLTSPSCYSSLTCHHCHTAGSCPHLTRCPFPFELWKYDCGEIKERSLPKGLSFSLTMGPISIWGIQFDHFFVCVLHIENLFYVMLSRHIKHTWSLFSCNS